MTTHIIKCASEPRLNADHPANGGPFARRSTVILSTPVVTWEAGDFELRVPRNIVMGAISNILDNSIYWLADHRSGTDAVGRLLAIRVAANIEPRATRAGLPQAFGSAKAPCPGSGCDRSLQKGGFVAELDKVRGSLPRGTPIEIWFQSLPRRRPGTRPGSDRRTRSQDDGRSAKRVPRHRTISAPNPPTSSVRSARRRARPPASSYRSATPTP